MFALGHELAQTPSHKFDLAHMRVLLEALEHPEKKFPAVLIAGTNGKGSTAATLASILQTSGYKTGLYTSPHLVRINERVRINGAAIGDNEFALIHDLVDRTAERLVTESELPRHPSFFEMLTAIAFEYFSRERIHIAILEVGMGGRLDATNVVEPRLTVITDIALDHQNFLGETITEIAREKAGILRARIPVVTLPQTPEANDVIGNAILALDAKAVTAVPYVPPVSPNSAQYLIPSAHAKAGYVSRYPLQVLGKEITVETPLVGRHQLRNLALAIASAEELSRAGFPAVTSTTIETGIRETRSKLSAAYEERPLVFVFGAMRDKAIGEIAEILFPLADRVIATHVENPRAATSTEIREAASRVAVDIEDAPDVPSALAQARAAAGTRGLVVVTGSIYIVGEAMRTLGARIE
jgi:dihydrofolate synthase/folylpolyglutamate synthase